MTKHPNNYLLLLLSFKKTVITFTVPNQHHHNNITLDRLPRDRISIKFEIKLSAKLVKLTIVRLLLIFIQFSTDGSKRKRQKKKTLRFPPFNQRYSQFTDEWIFPKLSVTI